MEWFLHSGVAGLTFMVLWTSIVAAMGYWGYRQFQRSRKTGQFERPLIGPLKHEESPILFRFQQGFLVFWLCGVGAFFVIGIVQTLKAAVRIFA